MKLYEKKKEVHLLLNKKKRGQAALEFLTTYGWALMSILLAIAALSYFGFLDTGRYVSEKCDTGSQIQCLEAYVEESGALRVNLRNNYPVDIEITAINLTLGSQSYDLDVDQTILKGRSKIIGAQTPLPEGTLIEKEKSTVQFKISFKRTTSNNVYNISGDAVLKVYPSTCGDGVLDQGEECDGAEVGTETCQTFGFNFGALTCTDSCSYDTSACSLVYVPQADGSECTTGTGCESGLCVNGICRADCSSTYYGAICSDDSNTYNNDGICAYTANVELYPPSGSACLETDVSTAGAGLYELCGVDLTTDGFECDAHTAGGYVATFEYWCQGNSCVENPCFPDDVKVNMFDGTSKNINDVKIGDKVWGFDEDTQNPIEATVQKVLIHETNPEDLTQMCTEETEPLMSETCELSGFCTGRTLDKVIFSSGDEFEATPNHPVYVLGKGWIPISELNDGDKVYKTLNGQNQEVYVASIIRDYSSSEVVYNLKTTAHSYYANNILVHNKCLIGNTRISMADGSFKSIENILPGEYVLGQTAEGIQFVKVLDVYKKESYLEMSLLNIVFENTMIIATPNHLFETTRGKISAGNLRVGDEVVTANGLAKIIEISEQKTTDAVWDIKTESNNYFANNLLVSDS